MRAAVLLLAFDHLGARTARSEAFADNPASLRVSEKLGYAPDGRAGSWRSTGSTAAATSSGCEGTRVHRGRESPRRVLHRRGRQPV